MADNANTQQTANTTDTEVAVDSSNSNSQYDAAFVDGLKKQADEYKKKVREYETKMKSQTETELKQKEEWQKFAQLKEQEAGEYRTKYEALQQNLVVEKKYNALKNEAVKLGLRQEAISDLELVDLSDIQIESTSTGKYNVLGAEKYAERLKAVRPHWFGGQTVNVNTSSVRVQGSESVDPKAILKAESEGRKSGDMSEYKRLISLYKKK